jgi:hypothetical protein
MCEQHLTCTNAGAWLGASCRTHRNPFAAGCAGCRRRRWRLLGPWPPRTPRHECGSHAQHTAACCIVASAVEMQAAQAGHHPRPRPACSARKRVSGPPSVARNPWGPQQGPTSSSRAASLVCKHRRDGSWGSGHQGAFNAAPRGGALDAARASAAAAGAAASAAHEPALPAAAAADLRPNHYHQHDSYMEPASYEESMFGYSDADEGRAMGLASKQPTPATFEVRPAGRGGGRAPLRRRGGGGGGGSGGFCRAERGRPRAPCGAAPPQRPAKRSRDPRPAPALLHSRRLPLGPARRPGRPGAARARAAPRPAAGAVAAASRPAARRPLCRRVQDVAGDLGQGRRAAGQPRRREVRRGGGGAGALRRRRAVAAGGRGGRGRAAPKRGGCGRAVMPTGASLGRQSAPRGLVWCRGCSSRAGGRRRGPALVPEAPCLLNLAAGAAPAGPS